MRWRRRLEHLEARMVEAGCPACRDRRSKAVYVKEGEELPSRCARCDKIPELIITIRRVPPEAYPDGPPPGLYGD
jgi:hypothetical protein